MPHPRRAFTLVEMVIVVTLMAAFMGTAFFSLGQIRRSWSRAADQHENLLISYTVAERIVADIRSASLILPVSSSQEVQLKVGADLISYRIASQKVRREKNGTAAYLTSENEIKLLSFSYPSAASVQVIMGELSFYVTLRQAI
jgi:prepilin-type N-terminal cleavage/methylation domain-containing protein